MNRWRSPAVQQQLAEPMAADVLASCGIVDLEALYSARNLASYEALQDDLRGLREAVITPATISRARDVQHELARTGHHRLPIADLVIAAAAELAGFTVLHYDADFERIAGVTGQTHRWVVPRGTI